MAWKSKTADEQPDGTLTALPVPDAINLGLTMRGVEAYRIRQWFGGCSIAETETTVTITRPPPRQGKFWRDMVEMNYGDKLAAIFEPKGVKLV